MVELRPPHLLQLFDGGILHEALRIGSGEGESRIVRLLSFFKENQTPELHIKTVLSDVSSLSDHASFISTKVNFLLDATLGLINNEQNAIIKIVSVAAVVFLPPTLVASIYGMNFDVMPELKWMLGYPFAILLMITSTVLPYVFFKRKGWL